MTSRAMFNIIGDDKRIISYRPPINRITGSVNATILLQQLMFRWKSEGYKPFYKFINPCNHPSYRRGDSWAEELGFTEDEIAGALRKIATKVKKGDSLNEIFSKDEPTSMVAYAQDAGRYTWWKLNEALICKKLAEIYDNEGLEVEPEKPIQRLAIPDSLTPNLPTPYHSESFTDISNKSVSRKRSSQKSGTKINPKESGFEEIPPSKVPDDFVPSERVRKAGVLLGFTEDRIDAEAALFIEYWQDREDKKAFKKPKGWQAAFGNWLRKLEGGMNGKGRQGNAYENREAELERKQQTDIYSDITD